MRPIRPQNAFQILASRVVIMEDRIAKVDLNLQFRASPIYARGKAQLCNVDWLLTFWLQSAAAGMGDRCRCGGLVGSGLGRRWRLKGSGRVLGANAPALR